MAKYLFDRTEIKANHLEIPERKYSNNGKINHIIITDNIFDIYDIRILQWSCKRRHLGLMRQNVLMCILK